MYTIESRVRFSEADHHETITLPGIINYFQDCSIFHSEDAGLGIAYLKERKRAWVLSSWQILTERYPRIGERIKVGTWATQFNGLYGHRNFCMWDERGERLAWANSIWVFMDLEKGRPVRPAPEDTQAYGIEPPLEMEYAPRKICLPAAFERGLPFPVRKYHIDTNEHVNNSQYVQMALEMLKQEMQIEQVRVEYKRSAHLGDVICPGIAREKERTVVELCDSDEKPYAIVELTGRKKC